MTLEDRFNYYSNNSCTKKEIDEAVFNFVGFVKTVMLMAKENGEKCHESSCVNTCIKQGTRRRKIS